jgi:hypothetical protein
MSVASASPSPIDLRHPPAGDRDLVLDLVRAAALAVVVLWHWVFSTVAFFPDGPVVGNPVGVTPGLWVLTWIMGAWIYTKYRIYVRIPIEQAGHWKTQGFFELKEHAATIGSGLLPLYWYFWKNAQERAYDGARIGLTVVLALFCWFNFIVGHVVNNVRGFGS